MENQEMVIENHVGTLHTCGVIGPGVWVPCRFDSRLVLGFLFSSNTYSNPRLSISIHVPAKN